MGFLPGVPQAHLALGTVALLQRGGGVEARTVRVAGAAGEQRAALVTLHSPGHGLHYGRRGGGGGGCGGGGRGQLGSPGGGEAQLCVDVIVPHSVAEVGGADTGRDAVRLQGGEGALRPWLYWIVNAAQEDAGGETLPDHRALRGRFAPGVVETGLPRGAGRHLGRVPGVEAGAVRGVSGEKTAAAPALDWPG